MREWQRRADELAADSVAAGEPYGWFDRLFAEAAAGETAMPWDRIAPQPLLASWAGAHELSGRAVVPGCGLGADAEYLAGLGFDTVGFDVSPTAVGLAAERSAGRVDYAVADLFDLPPSWIGAFDLVADVYTVQALPRDVRARVVAALTGLVAPGGTLFAVQQELGPGQDPAEGPPWPLTGEEFTAFGDGDLVAGSVERLGGFWRGTFTRPGARPGNVGGVQQDGSRG